MIQIHFLLLVISTAAALVITCTQGIDLSYVNRTNDDLALTWSASYAMSGILDMLELTGDACFADHMVTYADGVLRATDGHRFGNTSAAANVWSTTERVAPNRIADVVITGMIAWPLARFGALVRRNATLLSRFADRVAAFVSAAERAVAYFDDSWFNAQLGAYRIPASFPAFYTDSRGLPLNSFPALPINMVAALGRALFDLFDVTGRAIYLQRAASLCVYFDRSLTKKTLAAEWLYWPAGNDPSIEDTSHGSIDVDFATMCFERGGWLSHATLVLLANTLATVVFNGVEADGAPRVALTVKGDTFATTLSDRAVAGLWAALAPFRPDVLPPLLVLLVDKVLPDSAPNYGFAANARSRVLLFAGAGKLANGATCVRDSQCASNICFSGRVCATWLGTASTCTRHKECVSGQCYRSVCAALLGPQSTCDSHDQCHSGICKSANAPVESGFWHNLTTSSVASITLTPSSSLVMSSSQTSLAPSSVPPDSSPTSSMEVTTTMNAATTLTNVNTNDDSGTPTAFAACADRSVQLSAFALVASMLVSGVALT